MRGLLMEGAPAKVVGPLGESWIAGGGSCSVVRDQAFVTDRRANTGSWTTLLAPQALTIGLAGLVGLEPESDDVSQAPGTFLFKMTNHPVDRAERPVGEGRDRWRLNRAGIVNVYQYENEVLQFGGGRLLLRGVNGSGKSTAMNMLLPFLLTTRQGRIDAAGQQRGMLKSWMLSGRDDAQPVGYLWIEFERAGRYLVCGCGIKANRRSDTVTTWWFVTEKRPGIDFLLVERGSVPLSATRLRAEIDPDKVFGERHRKEYRRTIEERLFGGASVSQHMRLIDRVRTPRVGDRIDLDLPVYLVDALPELSEQALVEAASPLDDLDEHRRNVAELERTAEAVGGLLDVYRSYCLSELRKQAATGRDRLDNLRRCVRREKAGRKAAEAAASEVGRLDDVIGGLEGDIRRLAQRDRRTRRIAGLPLGPGTRRPAGSRCQPHPSA